MINTTAGRQKGLILVAASAMLFSTPGLFTRSVEASGWDVIFWRGAFGIALGLAFLAWRGRLRQEFAAFRGPAWLAALVWATGAIAYLQAYKLTTIANVSLIYGSAPLLSALVAWIVLGEKPRVIVMGASLLAFAGVAVVAHGSLGTSNLYGDALAFWMTVTVAIQFAIFRMHPDTPSSAVMIVSAAIAIVPSFMFGSPFSVAPHEIAMLAVFAIVFVLASTMLMEGSKYLPGGETALISNLEVPLQPVLAFLVFTELPPAATFIGGALILVAVLVSQLPETLRR
jgi:drug/metabolite transporter (DMT)-like permease